MSPDEIEDVLERKKQEEIERFNQALALQNGTELETPEMGENEVVESTETEKEIING